MLDKRDVPNLAEDLKRRTEGGRGADLVIECVGRPEAWELTISLARKAGRVCLFGGCPAESGIRLDTHRVHYDEITLKGTFHHTPDTVRMALKLLATRKMPACDFIQRCRDPSNSFPPSSRSSPPDPAPSRRRLSPRESRHRATGNRQSELDSWIIPVACCPLPVAAFGDIV